MFKRVLDAQKVCQTYITLINKFHSINNGMPMELFYTHVDIRIMRKYEHKSKDKYTVKISKMGYLPS